MKTYTFSSIAWKTTLVHTVTYVIVGLVSFLLLDYSSNYADPVISASLRGTDHPMVTAGPFFQVLRGFLFGIVFYVLRDIFFSKQRGWTTIWLVLIFVGILSPYGLKTSTEETKNK